MTTEDKKGSFVIYNDWGDDFRDLDNEERGRMILAIFDFQQNGKITDFKDRFLNNLFRRYLNAFRRDAEKWEETRCRRSEAGKKGGAPIGNSNASKNKQNKQNKQMLEQTSKNKQKQAKQAVNVNVPVPVPVNVNVNGNVNDDVPVNVVSSPPSDVFSLCESYQGSMLSPSQIENIKEWTVSADMVEYAISIAKDHNVYSLAYVGKIIQRWQNEKIKTVADARNDAARFGQRGKLTQNREYKGEFYDDNCPDDLFELELEVLSAANNHS